MCMDTNLQSTGLFDFLNIVITDQRCTTMGYNEIGYLVPAVLLGLAVIILSIIINVLTKDS